MILLALLGAPLLAAAALTRARGAAAAAVHLGGAALTLALAAALALVVRAEGVVTALDGFLRADALSAWMVGLIALVGGLAALEAPRQVPLAGAGRFYPLFHVFMVTMLLAVTADDVGIMWVAVEGTTLASVFLVNFERSRASLEAAYKYLIICSVGIALAFVGTVLIYFAAVEQLGLAGETLRWTALVRGAAAMPARVVELAFVFLLVGYGTKAGLAPMHTWLPDAHSEAPAPVSALMSGVLLSVGVYALLRFKPIVDAAAGPGFAPRFLVALGLLSMAVAAAFLWTSGNYKRMLAYSSVEHLGLVALGIGFGGAWGVAGAVLHVANHALAKSVLFLLAGRIREAYGSTEIARVRGVMTAMPLTGRGFLFGLLALMGLPPFGLFISEVMIFRAGFQSGARAAAVAGIALLIVAFAGLLRSGHRMLYGVRPAGVPRERATWTAAVPIVVAGALLVVTGLAWPPALAAALEGIATVVGR